VPSASWIGTSVRAPTAAVDDVEFTTDFVAQGFHGVQLGATLRAVRTRG
jgi:hypothetical protein